VLPCPGVTAYFGTQAPLSARCPSHHLASGILKPNLVTKIIKVPLIKYYSKLSMITSYLCLVWKMSSCNFNDVDVPRLCGWEQAMEDDADWTLFNR